MKRVQQSDRDHHLQLDVPAVVAMNIRDMCLKKAEMYSTKAAQARYRGLANMIERELDAMDDAQDNTNEADTAKPDIEPTDKDTYLYIGKDGWRIMRVTPHGNEGV